jgi:hypothetical protein
MVTTSAACLQVNQPATPKSRTEGHAANTPWHIMLTFHQEMSITRHHQHQLQANILGITHDHMRSAPKQIAEVMKSKNMLDGM